MMAEIWKTDEELPAILDWGGFVEIPPEETIEVGHWFDNGAIRIYWAKMKSNEGFGGLTVTESELRVRAHLILR
jgi:hypothetical protein